MTHCRSWEVVWTSSSVCLICSSSCLIFWSRCSGVSLPNNLVFIPLNEKAPPVFPCSCLKQIRWTCTQQFLKCYDKKLHERTASSRQIKKHFHVFCCIWTQLLSQNACVFYLQCELTIMSFWLFLYARLSSARSTSYCRHSYFLHTDLQIHTSVHVHNL